MLVPDGRRGWEGRWSWFLESESVMGGEAAAGSELVRAGEAAAGSETAGVGAAFPFLRCPLVGWTQKAGGSESVRVGEAAAGSESVRAGEAAAGSELVREKTF